mmetsp:Transcript_13485/g.32762  ORF Transcript_13485/g.32762 Transcript_13485/m.32762 type:complete len:309 (-) Transcript_13485:800-1726(-)
MFAREENAATSASAEDLETPRQALARPWRALTTRRVAGDPASDPDSDPYPDPDPSGSGGARAPAHAVRIRTKTSSTGAILDEAALSRMSGWIARLLSYSAIPSSNRPAFNNPASSGCTVRSRITAHFSMHSLRSCSASVKSGLSPPEASRIMLAKADSLGVWCTRRSAKNLRPESRRCASDVVLMSISSTLADATTPSFSAFSKTAMAASTSPSLTHCTICSFITCSCFFCPDPFPPFFNFPLRFLRSDTTGGAAAGFCGRDSTAAPDDRGLTAATVEGESLSPSAFAPPTATPRRPLAVGRKVPPLR